jgi:hypothetical protein
MGQIFVWTLKDVLFVAIVVPILVAWALVSLSTWWKQFWCKHDGGVIETQACNAICKKCLKNLGFIGTWRDEGGD